MALPEIISFAARLGINLDLDVEPTKVSILKAINVELAGLQVTEPTQYQHDRQIALMKARDDLSKEDSSNQFASTDLVPVAFLSQVLDAIQKNSPPTPAPSPAPSPVRPDSSLEMRTNVKAAVGKASSDFTKTRFLPFIGAGTLIAGVYGLRELFNFGDLELPTELFMPLLGAATFIIIFGYVASWLAQRRGAHVLRNLYDSEIQEAALERAIHIGKRRNAGTPPEIFAIMEEIFPNSQQYEAPQGLMFTRGEYRVALAAKAGGYRVRRKTIDLQPRVREVTARKYRWGLALDLLSTADLNGALDDAAGLALDRLVELKIIEGIVHMGRQKFRLIIQRDRI